MIVKVFCIQCVDTDEEGNEVSKEMQIIGPLITNLEKSQFQDFKCNTCGKLVKIMVNTLK